jgi:hypothetical protein
MLKDSAGTKILVPEDSYYDEISQGTYFYSKLYPGDTVYMTDLQYKKFLER